MASAISCSASTDRKVCRQIEHEPSGQAQKTRSRYNRHLLDSERKVEVVLTLVTECDEAPLGDLLQVLQQLLAASAMDTIHDPSAPISCPAEKWRGHGSYTHSSKRGSTGIGAAARMSARNSSSMSRAPAAESESPESKKDWKSICERGMWMEVKSES